MRIAVKYIGYAQAEFRPYSRPQYTGFKPRRNSSRQWHAGEQAILTERLADLGYLE